MKKYISVITVAIIALFIGAGVVSALNENPIIKPVNRGNWLYVGGDGEGNYSTIQEAIDNASDGDTIFVYNGTYYENILINKSINVKGEKKETTIIDGGKTKDVLKIIEDNIFLSDFTLCNSGPTINDAGVEIHSNDNIIQNNVFFNVSYGIWVINGENNILMNNLIMAKWDGIWIFRSGNNIMKNNLLFDCGFVLDGQNLTDFLQDIDTSNFVNNKPVYYYKNVESIKIPDNAGQVVLVNCSNCDVSNLKISDVTDCIEIMYSNNNTIQNNILSNSGDHGIRMFKSNYNTISNNSCSNNPSGGISFLGLTDFGGEDYNIKNAVIRGDCKYNILFNNRVTQNNIGVWLYTSDDNFISNNVFKKNKLNAFFYDCENKWENNFWGRSRFLPKPVFGFKKIYNLIVPWINFDWHPAKEPYNIY